MTNRNSPESVNILVLLTLIGCIAVIGANSLATGPIAPEIARNLGVSVVQVMISAAAYGLFTAFGALFLAPQIDKYGASRALRI